MLRSIGALLTACMLAGAASAQVAPQSPNTPRMVIVAPGYAQERANLGGGFIEYLFGDRRQGPIVATPQPLDREQRPIYANVDPAIGARDEPGTPPFDIDPRYMRQEVAYRGTEPPGTILIDTPNKFLYLVEPGGRALRYGIGVGRPGFTWAGVHKVTAKKEWPDWTPPDEMLKRQPDLPHFMAGGPNNPLGARALYLGSTLYRIHGTSEPWTIGTNVSSGCIRLRNADVGDLYGRVKVGAKVVVL
jgi:lipoprotein-anchoring transpeptidase ErfK/SrfK